MTRVINTVMQRMCSSRTITQITHEQPNGTECAERGQEIRLARPHPCVAYAADAVWHKGDGMMGCSVTSAVKGNCCDRKEENHANNQIPAASLFQLGHVI